MAIVDFDRDCAMKYAGVKPSSHPMQFQLSCAAKVGCDRFITHDERLTRKVIPGVQFIVPLEHAYV